jgi:hypothetical protein
MKKEFKRKLGDIEELFCVNFKVAMHFYCVLHFGPYFFLYFESL